MALATGSHRLGPDVASLQVRTYREGVAARAGHDLVIEVTRWEATVSLADDAGSSSVELSADARSLEVRQGLRGVKPLTDKDRRDIRQTIDEKVLGGQPIAFHSSAVRLADGDARLIVEGDLTIAGSTHPVTGQLDVGDDGRVSGTIPVTQSAWGSSRIAG
jgi:polyisoprenoid-binding protein YceI